MALPVDVSTFTLRFGKYTDAAGAPALVGLKGKLVPVDALTGAPVRLLHIETGEVIIPEPIELEIGSDGSLDIAGLAHTDLDVLSPVPFAYQITWTTATDSSPAPASLRIFVPAELGAIVDYDKLVPAPGVAGLSVPISVSINLLDAANASADAAEAAALAASEEAGDALSAATLSQNAALAAQEAAEAAALDALNAAASAAQAAVDATAADPRLTALETDLAASTNLATADVLVRRDAAGNFNVNHTPTAAGHPASKTYADALGTSVATANTIVRRSGVGWFAAAGISGLGLPGSPGDAASKAYVDALGTASETANTIVRRDGSGRSWFVQARSTSTPVLADELTRKDYVDTTVSAVRRPARRFVNTSQTITLTDETGTIALDTASSALTVTIPTEASVAFPANGWVEIEKAGSSANALTIVPAGGVTLRNPNGSATLSALNSRVRLTKLAPDIWLLTDISGATATPAVLGDAIVRRTGGGSATFQNVDIVGQPTTPSHATRKDYVDALGVGDAATPNTVARRNGNGDILTRLVSSSLAPVNPEHVTRKDYVDAKDVVAGFAHLDLIATADPLTALSSSTTGLVNRIVFQRILGSGSITKIGIAVTVTGGNVWVGLYRSVGSGRAAVPGALIASSGVVATPAVGYAEFSLGGTFTVQPGDWFAFGTDSGSAAFRSMTGNLIDGDNFAGRAMYGNPGFPAPSNPTGLTVGLSRGPLVIGVP